MLKPFRPLRLVVVGAVVVVLLLLISVLGIVLVRDGNGVDAESAVGEIRAGMSETEVIQKLGPPGDYRVLFARRRAEPGDPGGFPEEAYRRRWVFNNGKVVIGFDKDKAVLTKFYLPID
ncbi:MAG: hypothetical protein K2R98_12110 [Gemmataceae bacterium]|nr:hypothetical protein [Gemmataceae bacterium]